MITVSVLPLIALCFACFVLGFNIGIFLMIRR